MLFRKPLFLASTLLLVLSSFAYQGGVIGELKREMIDARFKKIALVLAGIALVAAMVMTLYSELVRQTPMITGDSKISWRSAHPEPYLTKS